MQKKHATTIWPYYFLMVCLFGLSLIAPSNWKQRNQPPEKSSSQTQAAIATATVVTVPPERMPPKRELHVKQDDHFAKSKLPSPAQAVNRFRGASVAPRQATVSQKIAGLEPSSPVTSPYHAAPFDTVPSDAVPSDVVPSDVVRTDVAPTVEHVATTRTWRPGLEKRLPSAGEIEAPALSMRAIPQSLLDRLAVLQADFTTQFWAEDVAQSIGQITGQNSNVLEIDPLEFEKLAHAVTQSDAIIARAKSPALRSNLRRARYALRRRLAIWRMAAVIAPPDDQPRIAETNAKQLAGALAGVRRQLGDSPNGRDWGHYLLLDSLDGLAESRASHDRMAASRLSQRVLARLQDARRRGSGLLVAAREMDHLDRQLRHWVDDPVDSSHLLKNVERYEQTRRPSDARLLAIGSRRLGWSSDDDAQRLGKYLNTHYRNANLRIAVSARLLNRLIPQSQPQVGPVEETIAGNFVYGQRQTSTRVSLKMLPDSRRISMDLNIAGQVHSDTTSDSGPATFHTRTETNYVGRKRLVFNGQRLMIGPAVTNATSHPKLYDVETDFDILPLFGDLARAFARSQHDHLAPSLQLEVEQRAANEARRTFDAQADPRLLKMMDNARGRLGQPLDRLGLAPRAIQMSSDQYRASVRYRLAGARQLGAHTPRPRAPGDSFASVQLHESVLNNTLENLQLNGRSYELHALFRSIAKRLGKQEIELPEELPQGVRVTFADQDAVYCRFEEGAMAITLRIAAIETGRQRWQDITVTARYRPQTDGLNARLVRTTSIRLSGRRLSTRSSIALRSIFSRMFTRNRPLPIVPAKIVEDPRLADLEVSQVIITDGWIGVAIGPRRTVSR